MSAKFLIPIIAAAAIFAVAQTTIPSGNSADPTETTPSTARSVIPGGGKMENRQSFTQLPSPELAANGRMTNPASPNETDSYAWVTNSTAGALTNQNNWWWRH